MRRCRIGSWDCVETVSLRSTELEYRPNLQAKHHRELEEAAREAKKNGWAGAAAREMWGAGRKGAGKKLETQDCHTCTPTHGH